MRSLFLKIFLSFWLTQALSLVLAIFVGIALRPQHEAVWESLQSKILTESVQSYQSSGEDGVKRYLADLQNSQHVRASCLTRKASKFPVLAPRNGSSILNRAVLNLPAFSAALAQIASFVSRPSARTDTDIHS